MRNIGPLGIGELVLAHPDPLLHAGGDGLTRVRVERRKPAQPTDGKGRIIVKERPWKLPFKLIPVQQYSQNIHDYTQRPHVTWLIILLWPKNLWGWMKKAVQKNGEWNTHLSKNWTRCWQRETLCGWTMVGAFPTRPSNPEWVFTEASAWQAHRRSTECSRAFAGRCAALSP